MIIAHLDLETRSRQDLRRVGAYRYAVDPTTRILMAGVSQDGDDRVYLWVHPDFETDEVKSEPKALEILRCAELVYAHNAPFELPMMWARGMPDMKLALSLHRWRCTAALARKAGLPWALEKVSEALKLPQAKDAVGKKLIKLFCEPRNGTDIFNAPQDHPKEWKQFAEYCRQDVRTEKAVHERLRPFELTGTVLETFLFDLRMNHRGVPINLDAAAKAQKIIDDVEAVVATEFRALTNLSPTQREKTRDWLAERGCPLTDMQSETVAEAIAQIDRDLKRAEDDVIGVDETLIANLKLCQRVLTLYSKLSFAAVKKIQAMLDCTCPDGFARGMMLYYGAGTGRWTSRILQVQNAKKPPQWMRKLTGEIYDAICAGWSAEQLSTIYGDPYELIAGVVRQFVHLPRTEVLDGDYNAIEGRIACWTSGQKDILEDWRTGKDLYKRATAFVEGIQETEVDSEGRAFGKVVELACLAGDTKVLTLRGLVPIREVTSDDTVWDGLDFVPTDGVGHRGWKHVIDVAGVRITRDHLLLCGTEWLPAKDLAANESTLLRALVRGSENLPLRDTDLESVEEYTQFSFNAPAVPPNTQFKRATCSTEELRGAPSVIRKLSCILSSTTGATRASFRTTLLDGDCSIGSPRLLEDASCPRAVSIETMGGEGYEFALSGERTARNSLPTSSLFRGTTIQSWRWTESTLTGITSPGTCVSSPRGKTSSTDDLFKSCRRGFSSLNTRSRDCVKRTSSSPRIPVFDLLNCGPRNRFVVWSDRGPLIVHNCQFGLGDEGFIRTCENWGIECDQPKAHKAVYEYYRPTHPKVVARWYFLDEQMRSAIANPGTPYDPFIVRRVSGITYLFLKLPSGRSLAYPHPEVRKRPPTKKEVEEMAAGKKYPDKRFLEISYWGQLPQSRLWGRVKLHGAKVFENETQAIAADFMAHGAITAEKREMPVFMLVHDQGLALRDKGQTAKDFSDALADLPSWAVGMPLKVEAKIAPYYSK